MTTTAPFLDDSHEQFRATVRRFVDREIAPNVDRWERNGIVDRSLFAAAGHIGLVGLAIDAEYGGGGTADFRYNMVAGQELARCGAAGVALGITLHNDITTPYFVEYCTTEQRRRWLPGVANGELITAIAMTEPGAGSDLAGIRTRARRDGDHYVLNGAKTFITNGINADLVIVAALTGEAGSRGISLFVVERDTPGFERGRRLDKIGMHSQDTAELSFSEAIVPAENLLGELNRGFEYLALNLAQERLSIAVSAVAGARVALGWTTAYVLERRAFSKHVSDFQNTKFVLAEVATDIAVGEAFVQQCVECLLVGTLTAPAAAMAKYWATEMHKRTVDRCLQLFGGYGYISEYPIARAYADTRVTTIYGGTSEIMKTIIAKEVMRAAG